MVDGADWKPEAFHGMWAKFRAVFVSVGLMDNVAEIDELAANGAMMLGARDTWWYRFNTALERLAASLRTVDRELARAALPAARELGLFVDRLERQRIDRLRLRVSSLRGIGYCQFLLAAQVKLRDPTLSAMAPFIPESVLQVADLELRDAATAPEPERRMRSLAAATKSIMEAYYKPILTGVWTLSALMVGKKANKPPSELGPHFQDLQNKFWPLLQIPWPTDYIDEDAKFVRNAAAHQSVSFDAATSELVLKNHGHEQRLTEHELRQRFGNMFDRAETMRAAFLRATGKLDSDTE